ncbi:MAG: hypothetical protein K8E66_00870, partial [Phycisphaerales bacterium]|nr:hypothetical protein [Phycisphaerales bacterium]
MTHPTIFGAARRVLVFSLMMFVAGDAAGQLEPSRMYYGVDRKMPMTVKAGGGDVEIRLHT